MTERPPEEVNRPALPSVDDVRPVEQGGPVARSGFSYQDEIAVGFLIEMLENPSLLKVHCETHDDVVLVREAHGGATRLAEFVQVKAAEPDKLWSLADLCARENGRAGTSIVETSFSHDKHREASRFRLVTLRPVVRELKILTFPFGAPGREVDGKRFEALRDQLEERLPGHVSPKGNGLAYWLQNCYWDERHSEAAVRNDNLLRLLRLAVGESVQLLPGQVEVLLDELRAQAKVAGEAKWEPDRDKKIITRLALRGWWEARAREFAEGAAAPSGSKLRRKMAEAKLPDELIRLAVELRRDYAAMSRSAPYMEPEERERLQCRVKAEAASLRARFVAGQLGLDAVGFHALCLDRMDAVNAARRAGSEDRSAYLKGCMYDIVDRCLLRFERSLQ